jgi:hypothetical protein
MADVERSSWLALCLATLVSLAIYALVTSIRQYWQLRKIPGPRLAAWSNVWLWCETHRKDENFYAVRKRLHHQYGPVQRYGPNRVMFSDLTALNAILGTSNALPKVRIITRTRK